MLNWQGCATITYRLPDGSTAVETGEVSLVANGMGYGFWRTPSGKRVRPYHVESVEVEGEPGGLEQLPADVRRVLHYAMR